MTVDTDAARPATSAQPLTVARGVRKRSRARLVLGRLVAVVLGMLVPLLLLEASLRIFGPWMPGNYDTGAYLIRQRRDRQVDPQAAVGVDGIGQDGVPAIGGGAI